MFVNGVAGETIEWKYGVPRGSVLSPLLFILFIDPMVSGVKCKSSLFADDVSLWSSHDDIVTIVQDMNADLSLISSWGGNNDLKFTLMMVYQDSARRLLSSRKHSSLIQLSTIE